MNIADEMLDKTIGHQIGVEGYKRRVVNQILAMVQSVHDKAGLVVIKSDLQAMSKRELAALLRRADKVVKAGYVPIVEQLTKEITAYGAFEASFQTDLFKKTLPIVLDMTTPADVQLMAAARTKPFNGALLKDWLSDLPAKAQAGVKGAIRQGFEDGRTTGQIVRQITGTKSVGGIARMSRHKAEATVRTAITHMASVATEQVAIDNPDIIGSVQWLSTLDGRTSMVCISRDGNKYKVNEGPRPPAHINCRSKMLNIPKSWKQLGIDLQQAPEGTRSSMDGQVAGGLKYPEWLKTKSKSFQDDVLGKKKAAAWRGGEPITKFVSRAGSEKTLDDLKAANIAAFADV